MENSLKVKIFTTEKIARILGLPEWRVVRFAQSPKYGITPAFVQASGSGTRRLYDVENVCEMALAFWLTQAGLRIDVIARTLQLVRKQGGLSRFLDEDPESNTLRTFLAIVRTPKDKTGSLTNPKLTVDALYIRDDWERLEKTLKQKFLSSALVIDLGFRFQFLSSSTAWDD